MTENLAAEHAVIYKIFYDAADTFTIELGHDKSTTTIYGQKDAIKEANDYIDDLYDEGIGKDIDDRQISMLARIAICKNTDFIIMNHVLSDGRNSND
ncbi:MAG TPA: hypothetical protein VFH99_02980 [Candidatus Saccharimonadales bacterium]|nr:hypothetical protein [Candidatus Saccharimonadales bacterium]